MVQASQRTEFNGVALVGLLARLADVNLRESRQTFADRLSHWVGWTDAIALSAALDGSPAAAPRGPRIDASTEAAQCARVRSAQVAAIAEDMRASMLDDDADFPPWRRRYIARQHAMASSIGPLRDRLRETVAGRSPALARLAALDTVMAQVLDDPEQRLLASVPALLEKHFKRLRQSGQAPAAFGRDMHSVLLAELDFRMQPVEGLLEALHDPSP
ncbi:MAG: DUF3348 family protein [Comamonadaceae bacterium]|nr:MAG: DUF3348 family protein [Comamonadaceae bacterium]